MKKINKNYNKKFSSKNKRTHPFYKILIVVLSFFLFSVVFLFVYYRLSSPNIDLVYHSLPSHSFAFGFHSTRNINSQVNLIYNKFKTSKEKHIETEKHEVFGTTSFIYFDMNPVNAEKLIFKIDDILKNFLDLWDEFYLKNEELDEEEPGFFSENEKYKPIQDLLEEEKDYSTSENPLSDLVDELWNGETFDVGGAVKLDLNPVESLLFSIYENFNSDQLLESKFLENSLQRVIPSYFQKLLKDYAVQIHFNTVNLNKKYKINYSEISVSVLDLYKFMDSLCLQKTNHSDFCSRFSLNRSSFRDKLGKIIDIYHQKIIINFNLFWVFRGDTLIFSNQSKNLESLLDGVSSGKKFKNKHSLLVNQGLSPLGLQKEKNSSAFFYFDMIRIQNEFIHFVEFFKEKSDIIGSYFSSPRGAIVFERLEHGINFFTANTELGVFKLSTDGENLETKIDLYRPSQDIFKRNNKNELNDHIQEFVNSFVLNSFTLFSGLEQKNKFHLPSLYVTQKDKWYTAYKSFNLDLFSQHFVRPEVHEEIDSDD